MSLTPVPRTPTAELRQFRVVYVLLLLNFALPAVSYIVQPELALRTVSQVNELLGGPPWPPEGTGIWHMLAVGNVMALAFMCGLLLHDLRRFYPVLPALAFLKGFSALFSLALFLTSTGRPAFAAIFVLDAVTTLLMVVFARRAHRSLA